jgi:hypothetical protein
MAKPMTKSQAQAFRRRWRRVNELEKKELRQASVELKFRQLAALMASARQFGWEEALREGEAEVRDRWMRLRKAYGA